MQKALLALIFSLAAPCLAGSPSFPGVPVDVLRYFVSAPGTCMSQIPPVNGSVGGYADTQQLDTTTCPGQELVVHTTGVPGPWNLEVFVHSRGFLKLYVNGGYSTVYDGWQDRVFYVSGRATGIRWAIDAFVPGQEMAWDFGAYADPWYPAETACQVDQDPPKANYPGTPFPAWLTSESWPSFLTDQRSGEPFGPYDIDVIRVNNQEGPTTETYIYGRWTDPTDGVEKGLGLVGFEVHVLHPDGTTVATHFDHYAYVVACAPKVPCFRCPDPPEHLAVTFNPEAPMPQKHQQEIQ